MFERLKSLPGSARFISIVLGIALNYLNAKYLHLDDATINWMNTFIIALISSDTIRQMGGDGKGLDLKGIIEALLNAKKGADDAQKQPPAAQ